MARRCWASVRAPVATASIWPVVFVESATSERYGASLAANGAVRPEHEELDTHHKESQQKDAFSVR